jgi:hypothetical protein
MTTSGETACAGSGTKPAKAARTSAKKDDWMYEFLHESFLLKLGDLDFLVGVGKGPQ